MNSRTTLAQSFLVIFLLTQGSPTKAATLGSLRPKDSPLKVISLTNSIATCTIGIRDSVLVGDTMDVRALSGRSRSAFRVGTDAGFAIEIMWTDWKAPGKDNNAENPVVLGPHDFLFRSSESKRLEGDSQEVRLTFSARESPLTLIVTYRLDPEAFYVRRKLSLVDSTLHGHFLQFVSGRFTLDGRKIKVIHEGGFGQPVALLSGTVGAFFGVEYPAADNILSKGPRGEIVVSCRQEMGICIMRDPVESNWTVFGVTPDSRVKYWFFDYLNRLRVAPLNPYVLYNSWYDLRAPEMVKDSMNIMNEANVLRMVGLIRKNMIEKHGIHLNAFVLDDGWDEYRSDWVLRTGEFPRGLRPIADALAKTETCLGLWFGPTGGYSHNDWRIGWMKAHGYETVNDQLCLAGANYSQLFRKRTTNLVEKEGVRYFKWDGIQFSCSDPSHGHPVGIFSRRSVLESVINKCNAVRAANPGVFLNVTSGTWLSPWWVQYANQIWMQGADYGYADVPSFNKRDAAMTYRDIGLYDDFKRKGYWFPIANLMTHGVLKAHMEGVGGDEEPLEKITDDMLLYLARGVSMCELYISPDILTEGEWNAISESILWARDRFPILSHTEMVGGDPGKREPYGYVHWKEKRGVVAARNPWIDRAVLKVRLDAADGLDASAAQLVLEKVYPTKWISPKLFKAGEFAELPLEGFEAAVYELYPVEDASRPLLAGIRFDERQLEDGRHAITVFEGTPLLLNPKSISQLAAEGSTTPDVLKEVDSPAGPITSSEMKSIEGGARIRVNIDRGVSSATIAVLARPEAGFVGMQLPEFTSRLDGRPVKTGAEKNQESRAWNLVTLTGGNHTLELTLPYTARWKGSLSAWVLSRQEVKGQEILYTPSKRVKLSPMPPKPWPANELRRTLPIGECSVERH